MAALAPFAGLPRYVIAHEADRYVVMCTDPATRVDCEAGVKDIYELYVSAYKGDYQAQRNLAWALQQGSFPARKDPVAACAWRLLIVTSGSAEVDQSDKANAEFVCGRLSASDLGYAKIDAMTLARRMTMHEPIEQEVISTQGLDGTAEPLE